MKKFVLLFFVIFLLKSNESSAQASLGISQYTYTIYNDTVPANSSDSIAIYVVNTGITAFNDYFTIATEVRDSNAVAAFHQVDTVSSFFPVLIAPGDSIPFLLQPFYQMGDSSTKYHYDINVIVIWPVASSASTSDSLSYNIFIVLPQSVNEIDLSKLINAYPNPTTGNLTLENSSQKTIEEVRIYDASGRLIQTEKNPSFICTDEWKAGTYLIKIQLENKQIRTIRVIKQ